MSTILKAAHNEWARRPADERFETLAALKAAVGARRNLSTAVNYEVADIHVEVQTTTVPVDAPNGQVGIQEAKTIGIVDSMQDIRPSNWSFGQICNVVRAPAPYIRKLPAELAAACLNQGLDELRASPNSPDKLKLMMLRNPDGGPKTLQALTSTTYGRIWDYDVVEQVEHLVELSGGKFFNPPDWTKKPSGLYASDRDIFIFMIDGGSTVNGGGERDQMHRGFFVSNSEVGKASLAITTFLFRSVCGNLLVWGAEDISRYVLKHTGGAPGRFAREAAPRLIEYTNASAKPLEESIRRAKARLLPVDEADFLALFRARKFTKGELLDAKAFAIREEGQCATYWDLVNGLTASAREIEFVDARVDLERRASIIIEMAQGVPN